MNRAVLGMGTLAVFLPSAGQLAGWAPHGLAHRPGPLRLLGISGALLYAALLAVALPRLADASAGLRSGSASAAVALVVLSILLAIVYDLKTDPAPGSRM
ncbi:hypothetical protein JGB26_37410 [Streptomyces flavofungini]|uniref:Uncharacterized protein n=1 Tax=Streptomyces flavofungini TaxID=68200 RepID=A0ABS0XHK8_9ACTN|nr:hypothetical protein [Streptomyces flavofungini]MBJ3812687.1 hypothetical protein [Streptomyces flavofungini]